MCVLKTYLYILPEISGHHLRLKCMGGHFFSRAIPTVLSDIHTYRKCLYQHLPVGRYIMLWLLSHIEVLVISIIEAIATQSAKTCIHKLHVHAYHNSTKYHWILLIFLLPNHIFMTIEQFMVVVLVLDNSLFYIIIHNYIRIIL